MAMGVSRTSEIDDSPEELNSSGPLSEPLAVCGNSLAPTYARENRLAAAIEEGRRKLQRAAASSGAASVLLLSAELAAFGGNPPPGASTIALHALDLALALAGIALAAVAAAKFGKKKELLPAYRAEICRSLKFRFLVDPNLWSRRGSESEERRGRLEAEAKASASASDGDARAWISAGSAPYVPQLPVGSNIDPHSVHVLVDYYEARRLNPALSRLADQAGASARSTPFSRRALAVLFFTGLALLGIRAALELERSQVRTPPFSGMRELSLALAAVALFLPAAGAAVKLAGGDSGAPASRSASQHQALSALSERLQKVSGAEAIFRELNFCEDVLEAESREALRRLAEPAG